MLKRIFLCALFASFLTFTSHAQMHSHQKTPITAAQKEIIVKEVAALVDRIYVLPEKASRMSALIKSRLQQGAYDKLNDATEFADAVGKDLHSVSNDSHLAFHYDPELAATLSRLASQNEQEVRKEQERAAAESRAENFGFKKIERLHGNICYLDLRNFAPVSYGAPAAVAAMSFLANCDALIIDLRNNNGGDPSQIQFISSYFFDEPTHLNDMYIRDGNRTEHYWTLPYVPGARLANADLYILTSKATFSAPEEFAYNLKTLKRATVIGETTGGGAHDYARKVVQQHFVLYVPYARAINPITKTNWEGTGVTPDILVPSEEALDRAYVAALEKVASKTTDARKKQDLDFAIAIHKAKSNKIRLDEATMQIYAGVYQDRKITLEKGELRYQRHGPKYPLIFLNQTTFILEGVEGVRFEFTVKEGKTTELIGIYSDGSKEPTKRSA